MGALINVSVNLDKLDNTKIIKGKNGNYYNFTVSVNDETSQYGDNASIFNTQTKEERESKASKTYVGNGKVVWTDGNISVAERKDQPQQAQPQRAAKEIYQDVDLPF